MIETGVVTILPFCFLIVLFGGGAAFRRRAIEQDGEAPIDVTLFYVSKYSILIIWGAMALQSWGIGLSALEAPAAIAGIALGLWVFGFALLFVGRFGLGSSFRLGTPKESTGLRTTGVYRISRNPMYLGVYATVLASILYTMNPLVLVVGAFVVYVHHTIVLAEEKELMTAFGREYDEYCRRVGRYIGPARAGLQPVPSSPGCMKHGAQDGIRHR